MSTADTDADFPGLPAGWPPPDAQARHHSARLHARIHAEITRAGGALAFDRYMELALYAPGLGYYVAGSRKFGADGDFITAPEVSPLFGRCLARQCAQVLAALNGGDLLELGAGSGRLAVDLLLELERLGQLPERYLILEVSPDLQERQRTLLVQEVPALVARVVWLERLPEPGFRGVVIGNELLDAMPVSRFRADTSGVEEQFVVAAGPGFAPEWRPATSPGLRAAAAALGPLPAGYTSEVNLRLPPWFAALARCLDQAVVLLLDYGYPRAEYYHPQRHMGTLICHYRHRAHDDPFLLVGLQDVTANVDFTAVAEAGTAAGLALAGFTNQAAFLLGTGLDRLLAEADPDDPSGYLAVTQGVKRLTLPGEMGERFKAIAFATGVDLVLAGFSWRDLRDRL